jgi:hypothetical protein
MLSVLSIREKVKSGKVRIAERSKTTIQPFTALCLSINDAAFDRAEGGTEA